jgi:hypothetical protein
MQSGMQKLKSKQGMMLSTFSYLKMGFQLIWVSAEFKNE